MYINCWLYSKNCLKLPLKKEDQLSLNAGQKYCRMLQGEHSAILLTFIELPFVIKVFVLSFFEMLLKTCFTVLTTCMYFLFCRVCRLTIRWIFFLLKWDIFTTKKNGSTGPTALASDGPYFEIMGQWPGPTINVMACKCLTLCWSLVLSLCKPYKRLRLWCNFPFNSCRRWSFSDIDRVTGASRLFGTPSRFICD